MIIRLQIKGWMALAQWMSNLLMGTGALMLVIVLWSKFDAVLYQTAQARHFETVVHEASTVESTPLRELGQSDSMPPSNSLPPLIPGRLGLDPLLLGRIEIPRLGLVAMVREGVEPGTLRRAVGHLPGSALPGQPGNFVVAGHRDSFFRGLRLIQNGDEILVRSWMGGFTYHVTALSVVDPSDIQAVQSAPGHICTLVTCFPFDYVGPAPRRFIVRAELELP